VSSGGGGVEAFTAAGDDVLPVPADRVTDGLEEETTTLTGDDVSLVCVAALLSTSVCD